MWISDDIINLLIKRYQDETGRNKQIYVMDTQFFTLMVWDGNKKKIANYQCKNKRWFKK